MTFKFSNPSLVFDQTKEFLVPSHSLDHAIGAQQRFSVVFCMSRRPTQEEILLSRYTHDRSYQFFSMFSLRRIWVCVPSNRRTQASQELTLTNQSTRTEELEYSARLQPDSLLSSSTIFFCFVSICLMKTNWHSDEKCEHSTFSSSLLLVHSSLNDDNSRESVSRVPSSAAATCWRQKNLHEISLHFLRIPTTRLCWSITIHNILVFDWTLFATK